MVRSAPSLFTSDEAFEARLAGIVESAMDAIITVDSGLRTDGEEFPVEASIPQVEAGGQKLYTVIMRDITERQRMEQQLLRAQRMESIGTLAGGIAHDLNNIFSPVMMAVEVL